MKRFCSEGIKVIALDRNKTLLEEVCREEGSLSHPLTADVNQPLKELEALVEGAISKFGRIDILVNCAGICTTKSLEETSMEDWDRILDINLKAYFALCKIVVPHMKRANYGRIVNISSTQSMLTEPLMSAYS